MKPVMWRDGGVGGNPGSLIRSFIGHNAPQSPSLALCPPWTKPGRASWYRCFYLSLSLSLPLLSILISPCFPASLSRKSFLPRTNVCKAEEIEVCSLFSCFFLRVWSSRVWRAFVLNSNGALVSIRVLRMIDVVKICDTHASNFRQMIVLHSK